MMRSAASRCWLSCLFLLTGAADLHGWTMLGMLLVTTGGGLGLVTFGPLSEWLGRRGAFLMFHLGGLAAALVLFQVLSGVWAVALFLPLFGFLTLGMHAGYAVYFPELFPTRLRSTGTSFCYNVGRYLASPGPLALNLLATEVFGRMGYDKVWQFRYAGIAMCACFLLGLAALPFAPETRGQPLPE